MTGPDEQKIPAAPVKRSLLCSRSAWILTGCVLMVLVTGMTGTQALRDLNQRVDQLELSQKTMTSQDDLATLRATLLTQQKQLTALAARQAEYQRQLAITGLDATTLQQLQSQLTVQQTALTALKERMDVLKKTAASAPSPVVPVATARALRASPLVYHRTGCGGRGVSAAVSE